LQEARFKPGFTPVQYPSPDTVDRIGVYLYCNPEEVERILSLPGGPANTGAKNGKQNMVYSTAGDL